MTTFSRKLSTGLLVLLMLGSFAACAHAQVDKPQSCIAVVPIPDEQGAGRAWFRALYRGPDREFIPTWTLYPPTAYLEVWDRDPSGKTAWVAGPTGEYLITATTPCGSASWAFRLPDNDVTEAAARALSACLVQVHGIPPVQGSGWTWVQSGTQGACGAGPKWSIAPSGASIYPYDPDPTIAYLGGVPGIYRIFAKYEHGEGQVDVSLGERGSEK